MTPNPPDTSPLHETAHEAPGEDAWSRQVYVELRELAGLLMAGERPGHTLEPTALVHETWLRLLASRNAASLDRGAFLGLASQAMRRILTEHARRRASEKRGGRLRRTTLQEEAVAPAADAFALDLESALERLARVDPALTRIFELRFFAGCSVEETAELVGASVRTVKRRSQFARAWLQANIEVETS